MPPAVPACKAQFVFGRERRSYNGISDRKAGNCERTGAYPSAGKPIAAALWRRAVHGEVTDTCGNGPENLTGELEKEAG